MRGDDVVVRVCFIKSGPQDNCAHDYICYYTRCFSIIFSLCRSVVISKVFMVAVAEYFALEFPDVCDTGVDTSVRGGYGTVASNCGTLTYSV